MENAQGEADKEKGGEDDARADPGGSGMAHRIITPCSCAYYVRQAYQDGARRASEKERGSRPESGVDRGSPPVLA
jgi:hypothetical protein